MRIRDWFRRRSTKHDSATTAIIVTARNTTKAIDREYAHLASACGEENVDWKLERQELHEEDGKHFDVITIELNDGTKRTFWFNITDFYGKS